MQCLSQALPWLQHPVWWAHKTRLRSFLAPTFYDLKQHPPRGICMLNKDEVREKTLLLAKRNESLEMGISGVHVSLKETGNGKEYISRAEMSHGHSPWWVWHKRSILLIEAAPSLGLFPSFCRSEGVLKDIPSYDSSICHRNRVVTLYMNSMQN